MSVAAAHQEYATLLSVAQAEVLHLGCTVISLPNCDLSWTAVDTLLEFASNTFGGECQHPSDSDNWELICDDHLHMAFPGISSDRPREGRLQTSSACLRDYLEKTHFKVYAAKMMVEVGLRQISEKMSLRKPYRKDYGLICSTLYIPAPGCKSLLTASQAKMQIPHADFISDATSVWLEPTSSPSFSCKVPCRQSFPLHVCPYSHVYTALRVSCTKLGAEMTSWAQQATVHVSRYSMQIARGDLPYCGTEYYTPKRISGEQYNQRIRLHTSLCRCNARLLDQLHLLDWSSFKALPNGR